MQNAISYLQDLSIYLQWSGFICAFVNLKVSPYYDNTWCLVWHNNPVLGIRYFYMCPSILFSLVTGRRGYRWVLSSSPFFCSTMLRNVTSHSYPSSSQSAALFFRQSKTTDQYNQHDSLSHYYDVLCFVDSLKFMYHTLILILLFESSIASQNQFLLHCYCFFYYWSWEQGQIK